MAKFKKGDPRPPGAGRKKGTKNKKKLLSVEEFFSEKGLHPLELLLHYVQKINNPTDQARVMLEVIQYWAPKLKHAEVVVEDTTIIETTKTEVAALTPDERLQLIRASSTPKG